MIRFKCDCAYCRAGYYSDQEWIDAGCPSRCIGHRDVKPDNVQAVEPEPKIAKGEGV